MHIIVDSTCDLPLEEARALGVSVLLLKVFFGSEGYRDKVDLANEAFFERLKQSARMPTTSMATPEDFREEFDRHPNEEILVITISSLLSGTGQSAYIARNDSERSDIFVVDSGSVSIGHALLIRVAARLRDEGMGAQRIAETLELLKPRLRVYAVIDTLKYLVKGGRLSGAQGALGTILSLKPIIAVRDGKVTNVDRARGSKGALRRLGALVEKEPADGDLPVAYAHAGDREAMGELMRIVGIEGPGVWLGSVVGAHTGPGAVAVAYFTKG